MNMNLNYIGMEVEGYPSASFLDFLDWFIPSKLVGFDVETNVCTSILDRYWVTLQFADKEQAWVLQWSYLTTMQQAGIIYQLNQSYRKLIIHGATFEGTICQNYGIVLKNIWDSYRQEQVLNTGKGAEQSSFDLSSVMFKRFDITMDKSQQLLFGDDIMTPEKVRYAALDVAKSVHLYEIQLDELKQFDKLFPQHHHKGLRKTSWWDNEFALVAADLEYVGFNIHTGKWTDCYNKSLPSMLEAKSKLDAIVIEEFKDFATEQGWLSDVDRFESIWGSTEKKKEILQLVFPTIESVTKLGLKEYLRDNDPDFPEIVITRAKEVSYMAMANGERTTRPLKITGKEWENHNYPTDLNYSNTEYLMLKILINSNEGYQEGLNKFFYKNFPDFMLEHNYVIPANALSLNWASSQQKLLLFQHIKPSIENTTALTIEGNLLTNSLFIEYVDYQEAAQLVSKFGIDYLKHVQADGRIRTVFNTVLSTGRLSAKEPNLLQLPRNETYRACFTAPEGFKIVDADWDQQELTILGTITQEPLWIEAFKNKWDLHSIIAQLLYEDTWDKETEDNCAFKLHKEKCKCKGHKPLRTKAKNLDFGLSYGLSAYGYAARNHISEDEAIRLINKFFDTFPLIKKYILKAGDFSVNSRIYIGETQCSFINENGTGRVRFFDLWKVAKKQDFYGNWIWVNQEEMNGVRRSGSNFTIQAYGASLLKVASVLFRRWINNNNLREHIQIVLPYHDQLISYGRIEGGYDKLAAEKKEHFMKLAGKLLLKNDLLRATANISDYWIKD